MSREEGELHLAVAEGRMRRVKLSRPNLAPRRVMFLCRPLFDALDAGRASPEFKRWAALEAFLETYVEGGMVTRHFMKPWSPKEGEIWTVRNKRPRPSLRVFGRFAMPDVFVATHVATRKELGAKWSNAAIWHWMRCDGIWWDNLSFQPFSGSALTDYVTNNAFIELGV